MRIYLISCLLICLTVPVYGAHDNLELTIFIQRDLQSLGYEIDNVRGELTMQTRIAIGAAEEKYQMPITGQPSFELAAKTKADVHAQKNAPPVAENSVEPAVVEITDMGLPVSEVEMVAPTAPDAACLQEHVDAKGMSRGSGIASAGARILRRFGNQDVVDTINEVSRTAADVVATSNDVDTIASELGLTEEQVRSCM